MEETKDRAQKQHQSSLKSENDHRPNYASGPDGQADAIVDVNAYADADAEEDSERTGQGTGNARVIMMHDDNGNAKPVHMGQFYYDSVVPGAAKETTQAGSSPSPQNLEPKNPEQTKISRPTPQRAVRGVQLSSSSEEEISPINNGKAQPRANVDEYGDTEGTKNPAGRSRDKLGEDIISEGKYENQFMRIPVAASALKDVSHVEKDVDHDKPKMKRPTSLIHGLKSGAGGERSRQGPAGDVHHRPGKGGANRMQKSTSYMRGNRPGDCSAGNDERSKNVALERERGNSIAGGSRRQAIGAIGRMLSRNRQKDSTGGPGASESGTSQSSEQNSSTHGSSAQVSSTPQTSTGEIADMTGSQSSLGGTADRPRASDRIGGTGRGGRAGISQVGRMLSRNRRKSIMQATERSVSDAAGAGSEDNQSEDREQSDGERSKARASLSKIGRMISFNRKQASSSAMNENNKSANVEGKQASPISTSTVSTASIGSPALGDRVKTGQEDRDRGKHGMGATGKKESRLGIRAAGRMFSLTRRNTVGSSGEGIAERNGRSTNSTVEERAESGPNSGNNKLKAKTEGAHGGSAKTDGRAEKFVYSEVTSPAIADSGLLGGGGTGKHIRVPVIAMAEFSDPISREKWYIDAFALPHNAVRRECIDLYDILSALARCNKENDLCTDDINKLEEWWNVAVGFFRCYFEMERRVLLPWVDSAGAQEWEVQLALKKMRSLKDKLENLLSKVDRVWTEKTFKTCGEMYALLYKAVDDFVPRLMNYFSDQEVLLPAMVKEFYKKENRLEIDKQMVAAFMEEANNNKDATHHNLILLVRWITKSRQLRAWLGKNLSGSSRAMYPTWYQMYEDQHAAIFKSLRSRATTTVAVEP